MSDAARHPFRSILLLLLLLWPIPAAAQVPDSVFIEDLTWTELRDGIQAGKTTVILPVGGTEQNGPHMAIGKHNFIIKHNADQIARRLGNALVAPVVVYVPEGNIDPPTEHMRWPGTVTLPREHFMKLIEFAARSFKLHGFKDVVFIGDHGSYQKDMKIVADALTEEWSSSGVRVHYIPQYYNANGFTPFLRTQGFTREQLGPHASMRDTSQLLAVDPKYVRMEKLQNGTPESGIEGDARGASVELGKLGLEFKIETGVERIREAIGKPQAK